MFVRPTAGYTSGTVELVSEARALGSSRGANSLVGGPSISARSR
jgi:hypothetical protein